MVKGDSIPPSGAPPQGGVVSLFNPFFKQRTPDAV